MTAQLRAAAPRAVPIRLICTQCGDDARSRRDANSRQGASTSAAGYPIQSQPRGIGRVRRYLAGAVSGSLSVLWRPSPGAPSRQCPLRSWPGSATASARPTPASRSRWSWLAGWWISCTRGSWSPSATTAPASSARWLTGKAAPPQELRHRQRRLTIMSPGCRNSDAAHVPELDTARESAATRRCTGCSA